MLELERNSACCCIPFLYARLTPPNTWGGLFGYHSRHRPPRASALHGGVGTTRYPVAGVSVPVQPFFWPNYGQTETPNTCHGQGFCLTKASKFRLLLLVGSVIKATEGSDSLSQCMLGTVIVVLQIAQLHEDTFASHWPARACQSWDSEGNSEGQGNGVYSEFRGALFSFALTGIQLVYPIQMATIGFRSATDGLGGCGSRDASCQAAD